MNPKIHTSPSQLSLTIADGSYITQTLLRLHTTIIDSFDKTTYTEKTMYLSHDTVQNRAGLTHHDRDICSLLPAPVWGFHGKEMKRVKRKNGQLSQNYQDEDNHSENCKILFQCSHSLSLCWFLHPSSFLSCCYPPSLGATCASLLKTELQHTPSGHVRV